VSPARLLRAVATDGAALGIGNDGRARQIASDDRSSVQIVRTALVAEGIDVDVSFRIAGKDKTASRIGE